MNKIKLNFYIFILIANLISSNFIYTQNITLDNFSISELDGKVYADITLGAGNTCNGIKLLRATDTINFQEIVNVEGVCGNSSTSTNYNLIDENPILNAINFYKVLFGIDNYSETYEILILGFHHITLIIIKKLLKGYFGVIILIVYMILMKFINLINH